MLGYRYLFLLIRAYAGFIVGASILAQWDTHLSSNTMRILWRTFSIISVILPLLIVVIAQYDDLRMEENANSFLRNALYMTYTLHILNRLLIIVFVFISFRSLPSDVYTTPSWFDFVPFFH